VPIYSLILKSNDPEYNYTLQKSTPGIPVKVLHILVCKNLQDISSDQQVPRRP